MFTDIELTAGQPSKQKNGGCMCNSPGVRRLQGALADSLVGERCLCMIVRMQYELLEIFSKTEIFATIKTNSDGF